LFTFYDNSGNAVTSIVVNNISTKNPVKIAITNLAGADKDTVQFFGSGNKDFTIRGITQSLDERIFLESLIGNTGSIKYNSIYMIGAPTPGDFRSSDFYFEDFLVETPIDSVFLHSVYFADLNWTDSSERVMERGFNLSVIEVK
jgi:hypothetical protein